MNLPIYSINTKLLIPHIEKIRRLYSEMDKAYNEAVSYYGFECSGCNENCCEERFYHYTLIENIYLIEGFKTLDVETRKDLVVTSEEVIHIYGLHDLKAIVRRVMCPLNLNGLCILYEYRPMICRLHGIPHVIKRPGQPEQSGPGCHKFNEDIMPKNLPYLDFDRTIFYSKMAAIEIEVRRVLDFKGRYRKTVAGMIIDLADSITNST